MNVCPECGSEDIFEDEDEFICNNCGASNYYLIDEELEEDFLD